MLLVIFSAFATRRAASQAMLSVDQANLRAALPISAGAAHGARCTVLRGDVSLMIALDKCNPVAFTCAQRRT